MNENEKPMQQEKMLDETKKNALLRYLGIMFAVAFLFVLMSMIGELRDRQATITVLDNSSTSAMQKAEQLQDDNRQLATDNAYLQGRIEELEKQLSEAEADLTGTQDILSGQSKEIAALNLELTEALEQLAELQTAYDQLQASIVEEEPAE